MSGASRWRDIVPTLLVLAFCVVFVFWAGTYPRGLGTVPSIVAQATVVFALLDLVAHTNSWAGGLVRRMVGQTALPSEETREHVAARAIALSILWPLAYVIAVIVFGFMAATPVYILMYMWLYGRKSFFVSASAAGLTTLLIWVTFEVLFRYPLYAGLLFGGPL